MPIKKKINKTTKVKLATKATANIKKTNLASKSRAKPAIKAISKIKKTKVSSKSKPKLVNKMISKIKKTKVTIKSKTKAGAYKSKLTTPTVKAVKSLSVKDIRKMNSVKTKATAKKETSDEKSRQAKLANTFSRLRKGVHEGSDRIADIIIDNSPDGKKGKGKKVTQETVKVFQELTGLIGTKAIHKKLMHGMHGAAFQLGSFSRIVAKSTKKIF
ncbi:MAG: putative Zn-dependent protease [Candidatus Omnitrophota bacterium]|jgi:predicted Zn-dependent protease